MFLKYPINFKTLSLLVATFVICCHDIWSGSKRFDTLIVFLKELIFFKKSVDDNKSRKNYPVGKVLN